MVTINKLEEFKALEGQEIGKSEWLTMTQERIDDFAKATGDFQWIHTDPERCKTDSPFGKPIAHGFLTLSLIPVLNAQLLEVNNVRMAINYGLDKTRFMKAVPVGSSVRLSVKLANCKEMKGGMRVVSTCTVELEGQNKPACIADSIVVYFS